MKYGFKAKSNGRWVKGFVQFRPFTDDAVMWVNTTEGRFTWVHVDKFTVCTVTNLYDKNGTPIYLGDILDNGNIVTFRDGCFFAGDVPLALSASHRKVTGNIHD
jgi:hypothetical protein